MVSEAAEFVGEWLGGRGIEVSGEEVRGLPVLKAEVGPEGVPTVVFHGHLDVVPARSEQFDPGSRGTASTGAAHTT